MKLTSSEPDIQTIVQRIDRHDIDLQPDFQRQEVWATPKKRKLIDTVLRGWSIPPIHLVEIGEGKLEVLDGQQRLASLRDFVHNRFSIDGTITPHDNRISQLHKKFYKGLDSTTKRAFDQYGIRCFKITDYLPEEPSELFYRLNQPTMLTAGEQRNALFGPARSQLKRLVEGFEQLGNDKTTLGFSNVRLAYDDILARLLFFLEAGSFGLKSTEGRISERFRSQDPFSDAVYARAYRSIQRFSEERSRAQPYRYNKANILSWLLFFSRFDEGRLPAEGFLQIYIEASRGAISGPHVSEVVALFEDRSSLRVTDVSSVVYRDFALNYLYVFLARKAINVPYINTVIISAKELFDQRADSSIESVLGFLIDIERWSGSL